MTISYPQITESVKVEWSVNFDPPLSGGPVGPWGDVRPLSPGYGTSQRDVLYRAKATIAGGGTLSLDLSGTLKQPDGITNVVMKKLCFLGFMKTTDSGAGACTVTQPVANGVPGIWSAATHGDVITNIGDKTTHSNDSGYVVTAATGDLLLITETTTTQPITLDILLIGKTV